MAELRGQRIVVWAAPVVLVVAVVLAVFLLDGTDGDDGPGASSPTSSTSSTAPTTPSPTANDAKVDPETWCTSFLAFADAQAQYVGSPDDPTAQQNLQDTADALLGIGDPIGLSPGGVTALQVLVDGALSQAGDPTLAPDAAPQDDKALADFLGAACPA